MSVNNRISPAKVAPQPVEAIAASRIPAEVAPIVEKALELQIAADKLDHAQDLVAAVHEELPVDLAQIANEFQAEAVAFANDNAGGETLLAQAGQDKRDDAGAVGSRDGVAGAGTDRDTAGALVTDDDGGLGGGWAAVIGLGVLAAAGGGGGGASASGPVPPAFANNLTFTSIATTNSGNELSLTANSKINQSIANNLDIWSGTAVTGNVKIDIAGDSYSVWKEGIASSDDFYNDASLNSISPLQFVILAGIYGPDASRNDVAIEWTKDDVTYYGYVLNNLTSATEFIQVETSTFQLAWNGSNITSLTLVA